MAKIVNNLIEGIGIADSFPDNPLYFTQAAVPETLVLPTAKPDMEQLLSVAVDPVIESVKLITTPLAISQEGQYLSGYKLIIELKLREKIKYVADEPTQTVHAAHFEDTVKSIFIVLPGEVDTVPIQTLFDRNKIVVTPYIEDIYAEMKDKRTIFKNITVFVNVTFLPCLQP